MKGRVEEWITYWVWEGDMAWVSRFLIGCDDSCSVANGGLGVLSEINDVGTRWYQWMREM